MSRYLLAIPPNRRHLATLGLDAEPAFTRDNPSSAISLKISNRSHPRGNCESVTPLGQVQPALSPKWARNVDVHELQPINDHKRQSAGSAGNAAPAVVELDLSGRHPASGVCQSAARLERRGAVVLGAVAASDRPDRHRYGRLGRYAQTNFQSELPASPGRLATLSWLGGTFQGTDIAGFHVYGEDTPGGGIDYTTILATVPAYIAGIITDGFGYGGFGQGGFGQSAGAYSWTSQPLAPGTWNWGVKPFDIAGNEGPAQTTAVTIAAPPLPPAPFREHDPVAVHVRALDETSHADLECVFYLVRCQWSVVRCWLAPAPRLVRKQ